MATPQDVIDAVDILRPLYQDLESRINETTALIMGARQIATSSYTEHVNWDTLVADYLVQYNAKLVEIGEAAGALGITIPPP